jgi:hypothetical protein
MKFFLPSFPAKSAAEPLGPPPVPPVVVLDPVVVDPDPAPPAPLEVDPLEVDPLDPPPVVMPGKGESLEHPAYAAASATSTLDPVRLVAAQLMTISPSARKIRVTQIFERPEYQKGAHEVASRAPRFCYSARAFGPACGMDL